MGSSIGSSYFSPPAVEMNTGTKFTPSRSSTPVESPNATQDYINGFQYSMPSDQNYEYYLSNHQNDVKLQQEIDGWGRQIEPQVPPSRPSRSYGMATRPLRTFGMASRPLRNFGIASRALKQSNYQSYEPTISRGSTYTSSTKKVKQIVDVSSMKVLLNPLNVTYSFSISSIVYFVTIIKRLEPFMNHIQFVIPKADVCAQLYVNTFVQSVKRMETKHTQPSIAKKRRS